MAGKFLSPKRRSTRQKSGFQVSGKGTGSTCTIEESYLIQPEANEITITTHVQRLTVPELFFRGIGVFGVGVYIRPLKDCMVTGNLSWTQDSEPCSIVIKPVHFSPDYWQRFSHIHQLNGIDKYTILSNINFTFCINTEQKISIYGLVIGALEHDYFIQHDLYENFKQKTSLYCPEILYLDPTEDIVDFTIQSGIHSGSGHPLVCKSCNRCDRFLPINIEAETQAIGYSNHCKKKAPCQHESFAKYQIASGDPGVLARFVSNGKITSHHGHQLECRVCKKFFVNLPLNPLRDSTQHREDSLRRRAFEVLVAELLGKNWIYHEHRMNVGSEFDVYIWEKFDKKCFKCKKELLTPKEMDLDHTLPLAYLWPLDSTATCLCPSCNSSKSDKFPKDFYTNKELENLSQKTGIPIETLQNKPINILAVNKLFERSEWFFDTFLADFEYQKERNGKKAADLIVNSLHKVLQSSGCIADLIDIYENQTARIPTTVSLIS